jgi:hypothetical protein
MYEKFHHYVRAKWCLFHTPLGGRNQVSVLGALILGPVGSCPLPSGVWLGPCVKLHWKVNYAYALD